MALEGHVISCHNMNAWKQQLRMGNDSNKLIVVDFTASWCGPCRFILPYLTDLAKKMPTVTFLMVDVDELLSVSREYAVDAMPAFVFLKQGKIVDRIVGVKREELQNTISKHMN